jgi:hypothetical protein
MTLNFVFFDLSSISTTTVSLYTWAQYFSLCLCFWVCLAIGYARLLCWCRLKYPISVKRQAKSQASRRDENIGLWKCQSFICIRRATADNDFTQLQQHKKRFVKLWPKRTILRKKSYKIKNVFWDHHNLSRPFGTPKHRKILCSRLFCGSKNQHVFGIGIGTSANHEWQTYQSNFWHKT